jgi:hypothetical protein
MRKQRFTKASRVNEWAVVFRSSALRKRVNPRGDKVDAYGFAISGGD